MPKKKKETSILPEHEFNESVENCLTSQIYDNEWMVSKNADAADHADFESVVDMLECIRNERDYEWMSDIFLPELPSIILTDASGQANQYFQTRDFVEVKLDGNDPIDKMKCEAAKKCINQTLNNRKIFHYHKYMRGRTINSLFGMVYAVCWWEQKVIPKVIGQREEKEQLDVDIEGNPITREDQIPATRPVMKDVMDEDIIYDNFNYEVIDPRNVATDRSYVYSIQQKGWIEFRREKTYEDLLALEEKNGYFNLDIVKEFSKNIGASDTAKETFEDREQSKTNPKAVSKAFDVILRFGRFPAIAKKTKEDGYPTAIEPGIDELGEVKTDSKLVSAIIEIAVVGGKKVLIRFQPNPYRDTKGMPYYPVVRGICYIHPTKDKGLSDGKNLKEIQIAMNDNFNMGQDRVKLATLPTFKIKKSAALDNTTIYFEPEHAMELDDPEHDLVEFNLTDNIDGSLAVQSMLKQFGEQVASVYPTTMGDLPQKASTTATAVAGAESRTNLRSNYKSLTFEYTYLTDFYWMILQMTYQFARAQTGLKMMGDYAQYFDPDPQYSYSPVTSNIETEYNKYKKIQLYDQTIGRLSGMVPVLPKVVPVIAHIISRQLQLQGDEYQDISKMIEELAQSKPVPKEGEGAGQPKDMKEEPTSNQYGYTQSLQERGVREGMA